MTWTVKAEQGDTLDSLAYRIFGDQNGQLLPQIMELNPDLYQVFLATNQLVVLPDKIISAPTETLKLWD